MGISRSDFVQECMNKVIADFAAQDAAEASKLIRNMVDNMTDGTVRQMRTRIGLLAQPESMRAIVGATQ